MKHIKSANVRFPSEVISKKKTRQLLIHGLLFLIGILIAVAVGQNIAHQKPLSPIPPIFDPKTGQVWIDETDLQDRPLGTLKTDRKQIAKYMIVLTQEETPEQAVAEAPVKLNDRAKTLEKYLKKQNSPLAPYAQLIVDEADEHGIDYTKIVAISKIESTFGKHCPQGSHNAWGITGTKGIEGTIRYFASWEEGIKFTSALLGNNYKYQENQGVRAKYCPTAQCNPKWAEVVTNTSNEILTLAKGGE